MSHLWRGSFFISYCLLMFLFSYINPAVSLTDVRFIAVSARDFLDSSVFHIDLRFELNKTLLIFWWALRVGSILCFFSAFSFLMMVPFTRIHHLAEIRRWQACDLNTWEERTIYTPKLSLQQVYKDQVRHGVRKKINRFLSWTYKKVGNS